MFSLINTLPTRFLGRYLARFRQLNTPALQKMAYAQWERALLNVPVTGHASRATRLRRLSAEAPFYGLRLLNDHENDAYATFRVGYELITDANPRTTGFVLGRAGQECWLGEDYAAARAYAETHYLYLSPQAWEWMKDGREEALPLKDLDDAKVYNVRRLDRRMLKLARRAGLTRRVVPTSPDGMAAPQVNDLVIHGWIFAPGTVAEDFILDGD